MNYIFFALLAAICFATSSLISKFISKHRIPKPDSLFVLTLFLVLPNIILIPFLSPIQFSTPAIAPLVLYSLFFTLGLYFFTKGIYLIDASVAGPLFQVQSGLIVILAAIFLNEKLSTQNYLWIALLLVGAILVTLNEKMSLKSFLQTGVVFILIMQVLHAISNIFVRFALTSINPFNVIFFGYILHALFAGTYTLIKKPILKFPSNTILLLYFRGAVQFIGATSLFYAFQQNVSISSTLGLLSAPIVFIVSVIASKFYPKLLEHHSAKVYLIRGLGLVMILFGATKLAVG